MIESVKFWISLRLADLGLCVALVFAVIFLCVIVVGVASFISAISKKAKEKQQEYWKTGDR